MARRTTKSETFLNKLAVYAEGVMTDAQKVKVAKTSYLLHNKKEIIEACERGYPYFVIAELATTELLKTDVPKSFTTINKENEEVEGETKIYLGEIKKYLKKIVKSRP